MQQMSIYDFMPKPNDLDAILEADMVQIVGNAIGIEFRYIDELWKWEARPSKRVKFNIGFSNYSLRDNKARFISCGYSYGIGGAGSPCNTIDEAIGFFKKYLEDV